ncbi:MAG: hypothetical protein GXY86_16620 [Firmicutes bacterium]|nr:hypothetical protein [Bacillota bacterium]
MGFEYKDSWLIHLGLSVLSSTLYTVIGLSIIYLLNFFLPGDLQENQFVKFIKYSLMFRVILIYFLHRIRLVLAHLRISSSLLKLKINHNEEFIKLITIKINSCMMLKDTFSKKIDILKYFSPFSFLPFFLGLFIDNKPFMNRVTPILDLKMSIHDLIIYVGFLIFFVYIISIYNTYFDYQQANMTIEAYQNELNKLVENN